MTLARRLRLPLVLAAVVVAAFVAVRHLRSREPGLDDPLVRGEWSDGRAALVLDSSGAYSLAVLGTSGATMIECGRWQADDGLIRMRADWQSRESRSLDSVLLRQTGIHLARYERSPQVRSLTVLSAVAVDHAAPAEPPGLFFERASRRWSIPHRPECSTR